MSKPLYLSASRVKTAQSCSWKYYVNYILKIRGPGNEGSSRGSVTHAVLEYIQNERHRHYYEKIKLFEPKISEKTGKPLKTLHYPNSSRHFPSIVRLVKILASKQDPKVDDEENLEMIFDFIDVGLRTDFLVTSANEDGESGDFVLNPAEETFKIDNEDPEYKILGFIDKNAETDTECIIVDYKTSKAKFQGKDLKFNIQGLTYALAKLKANPKLEKIMVRFQFLKFKNNPNVDIHYTKDELLGFERFLSEVYLSLKDFNPIKARSNFAKFGINKWMCGKLKGEMNAAGNKPAFVCEFKYPFEYWQVQDKEGNIVKSIINKEDVEKYKQKDTGNKIVHKIYEGCPVWKNEVLLSLQQRCNCKA